MIKISFLSIQFLLFLCLWATPYGVSAQEFGDKEIETEIIVNAKKISSDRVIFNRKEIQQLQAAELKDLLSSTIGIDFSSQGSLGQLQSIFIRGGASDQCLVILDGMILNDMSSPGGGFDFSWLNPKIIEKIEVYKNPKGALFGAGATSGAIVITTIRPSGGSFVGVEVGSNNQQSVQAAKTFRNQFLVAGNFLNNKSISSADSKYENSEKDSAQKAQILLKYESELTDKKQFNVKSLITNSNNDYDLSGGPGGDDVNAKSKTSSQNHSLEWITLLDKSLSMTFRLGMSTVTRAEDNPEDNPGDFYLTGEYNGQSYRTDLDFDYEQSLFNLKLKSFLQTDSIDIDSTYLGGVETLKDHYDSKGAAILFDIDLNEETSLSPNVRYDCRSNLCQSMTEFIFHQNISSSVSFEISGGRSIKFPSLYQKYAVPFGNANLNPETVDFKAVKVELNRDSYFSNLELYQKLYHNLIDFSASSKYENVKKVTAQGVDFENKWIFTQHEFSLNLAYQEAMNDLTNTALPRRARTQYTIQEKYLGNDHWDVLFSLSGRGPRLDLDSTLKSVELPSYSIYDVIVHYSLNKGTDFYLKLLNLGDAQYEETWGYGTERRRIFLSWLMALD